MSRRIVSMAIVSLAAACMVSGCSSGHIGSSEPITITNIPWGAYEKAVYEVYERGQPVGTAEFMIERSEGANAYTITKTRTGTDRIESGATIAADTLLPITSYYYDSEGRTDAAYGDRWRIHVPGAKNENIEQALPENAYDNESLLTILRTFKLAQGQTITVRDAIPRTLKTESLSVKWTGTERIEVPYGAVDCDVMRIGKQTAWYATGEDRIMVQYRNGDTLYMLVSVDTTKPQ